MQSQRASHEIGLEPKAYLLFQSILKWLNAVILMGDIKINTPR